MEHDDIFNLSPIPMMVLDSSDHSFLAINKCAQRIYGFSLTQLMGMTLEDVLADPKHRIEEHMVDIADKVIQRHRNAGGGSFLVKLFITPITYSGRKALLVNAVELEQDSIQGTGQNMDFAHYSVLDEEGKFIFVSQLHSSLLGCEPEELSENNIFNFVQGKDKELITNLLKRTLREQTLSEGVYAIIRKNGEKRWLDFDLSVVTLEGKGKAVRLGLCDVTEMTERDLCDQALQQIEKVIAESPSLEILVEKAIQVILGLEDIRTSEIWLASMDSTSLSLSGRASKRDGQNLLKGFSPRFTCNKGEGLPGKVWMERGIVVTRMDSPELGFAFGIPIIAAEKFLGCFICYSIKSLDKLDTTTSFLERVSLKIATPIAHEMKESEYLMLFDISPDPHCILGRDGQIDRYNRAFAALVSRNGIISPNTSILQIVHPEDISRAIRDFISMVNGWNIGPFRSRIANVEGNLRTLLWSAAVSRESMRIIVVGKDVTEQDKAEQELHGALHRLQNAQRIAKLGYWYRPIDTQISVWSEETYNIYERSSSNFLPTMENLKQTFLPDDRYLIEKKPELLLSPNVARGFEHRIITPSGRIKWVRQEVLLVTKDDGTPVKVEGTIQDITERKTYEERLNISYEIFRLAMLASNEMIWHVDLSVNTFTMGKGGQQPLEPENSEEFTIANSWFSTILPNDRQKVWDSLWKVIDDKYKSSWSAEYRRVSADGCLHHYEDRCQVLRDDEGNAIQLVGAALDVTTSRMHLEMIEEQNRLLREIAWAQSHELRAPLTRLLGLAEVSLQYGGGGLSQVRIMELIKESAEELDIIIRSMTEKSNSTQHGTKNDTSGR
ncbi:PAS domain-containing protein [Sphingobacterium sp. WM]|uniref:PAS domain-containing protein n=1 Tax=Sphingobacterium sp. WM TaxID=3031802 RepID=UPI00240E0CB9|nr:PAS domain-containing protein [Sphingobacterium sp. WM]WFB63229.1 PAS domain-containing protein [Sphingobacterium sp. WM]